MVCYKWKVEVEHKDNRGGYECSVELDYNDNTGVLQLKC